MDDVKSKKTKETIEAIKNVVKERGWTVPAPAVVATTPNKKIKKAPKTK